MLSADREKWKAWLEQQMSGPSYASVTHRPECHGGPIDGMLSAVAENSFKVVGAALHVPCLLVLQTAVEGPVPLEHRYARDSEGAYRYVGVVRK